MEIPQASASDFSSIGVIRNTDRPTNCSLHSSKEYINRAVEVSDPRRSSTKSTKLPKFKLAIRSSITLNHIETIWVLHSSGCRRAVINFFFHKWLFSELTEQERLVFLDFREVIQDPLIYSALRASTLGYPKKQIRKCLSLLANPFFNQRPPSIGRWNGYKTFSLTIEKVRRPYVEKKGIKYSGWRRHQNDQGSLGPQREDPFFLEPFDEHDKISFFLECLEQLVSGQSELIYNNIRISLR